ncbi:ABC transporter permease [Lysobacter enzymogenes]|uniref:ABC transporter permease n=1 Tax=Lysobacter enzymogenes TaxID=69 RepID=UPI00089C153A|nr:hypothetical protein [Lysobacter enzymogenes]SDW34911.1 ABC-type polysaccharide/polyol phosphate export permease [Lysobacter enzymogenes]
MTTLFSHLRQSLRRPDHWLYGSWLDTVIKHRRTRLGLAWLLIPTAIYIWGIGGFLAAMQPGMDRARYFAHVGLGFALFRLLTTVLADSATAFSIHQSYILDGQLRLTDYVLRALARSFYYFVFTLPLVIAVTVVSPSFEPSGIGLSLLGMAALLVNTFLIAVVVAIAGARFPDLAEMVGSIIMASFLITPVVWYPEAAPAGSVTGDFMRANPFHHMLAAVRGPVLGEQVEPMTWWYLAAMAGIGTAASALVYRSCARRVPLWL